MGTSPLALGDLSRITSHFGLGSLHQAIPITTGLIQETWRLQTDQGWFIAQKLHPAFDPLVTSDAAQITNHLRAHGIPCPQYLHTLQGSLHLDQWRVMPCLPGCTVHQAPHPNSIYQAGWWTGRIHRCFAHWDYVCQFQLPHFHDTPWICQQLSTLTVPGDLQAMQAWLVTTVPQFYLPPDLPRHLIHGDLKITNFLFDSQGHVTGILDWDTCLHHSPYIDLGDGLRSWCYQDPSLFGLALKGYHDSGAELGDPAYAFQGWQLITLELAMRFLQDIVEDHYFAWDPQHYPSRREHNRARLHRQIDLFHRLTAQRDAILSSLSI